MLRRRTRRVKQIGIYSGSFDPIHEGHLAFAREAMRECRLDKIFFLVEPRPRHKQGVKAFGHRNAMLELAIKQEKQFGNIIIEQSRFSVPDTLPVLKARFKGAKLFMLLGDDVFAHLASWPHSEDLAASVTFIVGTRAIAPSKLHERLKDLQEAKGLPFSTKIVSSPLPGFSSTDIRLHLKKHKPVAGLSKEVIAYIKRHKLYESGSAATS